MVSTQGDTFGASYLALDSLTMQLSDVTCVHLAVDPTLKCSM